MTASNDSDNFPVNTITPLCLLPRAGMGRTLQGKIMNGSCNTLRPAIFSLYVNMFLE
jgi:hypothetical protein